MVEIFQMPTKDGNGMKLKRYQHDIIFPFDVNPVQITENVKQFKYQNEDILFCSYPKSGINWIGNTSWKLKTTADTERPKDDALEFADHKIFDLQEAPRLLFTHLRPSRLPRDHIDHGGKIALLLRNPKDVIVSYYHFVKNSVLLSSKQTFDEFFESFVKGDVLYHSYFDYMKEWDSFMKARQEGQTKLNVEVFYYEDFKKDHRGNLVRLDNFLGFNRDSNYLDRVMRETTMEALDRQDRTVRKGKTSEFVRDKDGNSVIYRKGIVGDWKSHLTEEQSETIDRLLRESTPNKTIQFQFE